MLRSLSIESFALINKAEFEFGSGFIGVTGETGAGKSVFLGALKFLAGGRGDRSCIRPGQSQCKVEALLHFEGFQLERVNQFLQDNALSPCVDGDLILRRILGERQKICINGDLAPLQVLKKLSSLWVEFHDPLEPQRLFQSDYQVDLLDTFAGLDTVKAQYLEAFHAWRSLEEQLAGLKQKSHLSPEEMAYLHHQLGELNRLDLTESSIQQLEEDFDRLGRQESCLQSLNAIARDFDDEVVGINDNLRKLRLHVSDFARQWSRANVLSERLDQVLVELQEVESLIEQEREAFEFDPEEAECVQQQMQIFMDLKRRYGGSLEAVCQKKRELQDTLSQAEGGREALDQLEKAAAREQCIKLALALHDERAKNVDRLNQSVEVQLKSLGFAQPKFVVQMHTSDKLTPQGVTQLSFTFASDVALSPKALSEVASSGELSRLLLALKIVLRDVVPTPVLVFDEIDANVGGEIGSRVGHQLRLLGDRSQVFCVTHLPQVAAQVQEHFVVRKEREGALPVIHFHCLSTYDQRLSEIARMLGNAQSSSALQHAKVLLDQSLEH